MVILCRFCSVLFTFTLCLGLLAIAGEIHPINTINHTDSQEWAGVIRAADAVAARVSGTVQYKNTSNTPVPGVRITIAGFDTVTGPDGRYSFFPVAPGTYTLIGTKTGNGGGITVMDALFVARYFVGLIPLDSLNRLAADVTDNGMANAADSWFILRHVAALPSPPFPRGDWVFLPQTVIVRDSNVTVNLPALCVGDVNGSFVPLEP